MWTINNPYNYPILKCTLIIEDRIIIRVRKHDYSKHSIV